jgi:hypothetical protein
MMTWLRNAWLVGVLAALLSATSFAQTTQPAQASTRTLMAYGSSDHYWIASVESYKDNGKNAYKTEVRDQSLPAGDWKDLGTVLGYATGLAQSQGEVAILLSDESWKRLGPAGLTTGLELPGTGPVLAWGNASSTLYAVRAVEGGKQALPKGEAPTAATHPSTKPSAPHPTTTAATTRPLTPVLLRYDKGQWQAVADLPGSAKPGLISICGVGNKLLLASSGDNDTIHTWAITASDAAADSKWEGWGEFHAQNRPVTLGAIAVGHVPAVWTRDQDEGIRIFVKREGEEWSSLKNFELPKSIPTGAERTIATAGDEIRLVVKGKDEKIWEQRYDPSGAQRGQLTALPTPQAEHESQMTRVLQMMALLAMVIVLLVTFYKRRTPGPKDEEP